jgi:WD40 repeat protein
MHVISGSDDTTVRIWTLDGSAPPRTLGSHDERVYSVAFSPDGKRVVSGAEDKTVRIWLVENDDLLTALWQSPRYCLSPARRAQLLLESPEQSERGTKACLAEFARLGR